MQFKIKPIVISESFKKKFKKILFISVWCVLIVGLCVTLGFVDKKQESLPCKSLDVYVDVDDDNFFVDQQDIKQLIRDRGDSIIRQPLSSVNIAELENVLNNHVSISKAEVYVTVDGEVKVDILQRKPIIRIINNNDESYYIDDAGKLMPLSEKYTARVLIANGNLHEPYASRYKYSVNDILKNPMVKDNTMIDDLFLLAQYIGADEFWSAQIQQVYVNQDNEFELIPRVGDHKIIFGDVTNMDEKFKKLIVFYKEGLNSTDGWNSYSSINLKFKNQIVCTKKE